MLYGKELIRSLEKDIEATKEVIANRWDRIEKGWTDIDDCFISDRGDQRELALCRDKIRLIEDGGTSWFTEYATLDGALVKARWCDTKYGYKLRVEMPDGSVVWTSSYTQKGLSKRGLKMVECRRPAWYKFSSAHGGMLGVYTGDYVLFPSDVNYATGEQASVEPIEIRDKEMIR